LIEDKKVEELWDDLNLHLSNGVPDVDSLHRAYNALTKFMSSCMVVMGNISAQITVDDQDAEAYQKNTREMILQSMHYNERRMLRHLKLPKEKKSPVASRRGFPRGDLRCP